MIVLLALLATPALRRVAAAPPAAGGDRAATAAAMAGDRRRRAAPGVATVVVTGADGGAGPRGRARRLGRADRHDGRLPGAGRPDGDAAGHRRAAGPRRGPRRGDAVDAARLLGRAEERARYARPPLPGSGLTAALRAVRKALAEQADAPHPAAGRRAAAVGAAALAGGRGRRDDVGGLRERHGARPPVALEPAAVAHQPRALIVRGRATCWARPGRGGCSPTARPRSAPAAGGPTCSCPAGSAAGLVRVRSGRIQAPRPSAFAGDGRPDCGEAPSGGGRWPVGAGARVIGQQESAPKRAKTPGGDPAPAGCRRCGRYPATVGLRQRWPSGR